MLDFQGCYIKEDKNEKLTQETCCSAHYLVIKSLLCATFLRFSLLSAGGSFDQLKGFSLPLEIESKVNSAIVLLLTAASGLQKDNKGF